MIESEKRGSGGTRADRGQTTDHLRDADGDGSRHDPCDNGYRPSPFPHPPWTVGLVLVAGVITLLFGVLVDPLWLLVGSPFVLVLVLWLYVRLFVGPVE